MFITIFNLLCSIYDRPIRSNRLEDNCWWYIARHLRYGITEVLKFCPKSPMLDFMVNHSYFFILVTWISLIIIWIFGGIHENVTRKNRNFGGIHGRQKKKIETTWRPGWALGPPLRPSASAPALEPSLGTRWFQFILFLPSMNTTKVSIFSVTIFVNTTQNSNNNPWIPGHKNKKIWAVYHEIQHWWFWTKF